MSLYEITESGPSASDLAKGFLMEANAQFQNEYDRAVDLVQRFWFRNRDEDGNPALEGDEPTGIEIMQAMGTSAKSTIDVAYARVQMLLGIATALGRPELIDLTKLAAPYDLVFAADGSLESWKLRQ